MQVVERRASETANGGGLAIRHQNTQPEKASGVRVTAQKSSTALSRRGGLAIP
jgi:hypothetical protein